MFRNCGASHAPRIADKIFQHFAPFLCAVLVFVIFFDVHNVRLTFFTKKST